MPKTRIDINRGVRERLRSGMFDVDVIAQDMGIKPRTVYKHMKIIKDEQNAWLEHLIHGAYIQKFKQTLDTFDYQAQALLKEMEEMKKTYKTRNLMLQEELENFNEGRGRHAKFEIIKAMVENDNSYFSNLEKYRRFIKDTEKESLYIQSKTSSMWALKKFVKENSPRHIEDPRDMMISGDIVEEGVKFELHE